MKIAEYRVIPSKIWNHDPTITDEYKNTVAINLAERGIIPPKEWYHDPKI